MMQECYTIIFMKICQNLMKFNAILLTNNEILHFLKIFLDFDEKYTILEQIFSGI